MKRRIYASKVTKKVILWTTFICSVAYIIHEVRSFSSVWKEIKILPAQNLTSAFFFVFALMFGNWITEAKKWQYLAKKTIPEYTFRISFQTVLCGITLGLFTPNRVGEYGARLFYVENEHKANLLVLAFVDRLAQLWVTVLFGFVFIFVYTTDFFPQYQYAVLFTCITLLGFHLSIVVFRNKIIHFMVNRKILKRYFTAPIHLSSKDMVVVLGYASLRYCIFVAQYLIWGYYTDSFYAVQKGLVSINTMLFIKSVVPSAGLSELGIRESILIYLYKSYGMSAVTAFHSALVIYTVNLLVPAVIGLFFMPRMALWKEKPAEK